MGVGLSAVVLWGKTRAPQLYCRMGTRCASQVHPSTVLHQGSPDCYPEILEPTHTPYVSLDPIGRWYQRQQAQRSPSLWPTSWWRQPPWQQTSAMPLTLLVSQLSMGGSQFRGIADLNAVCSQGQRMGQFCYPHPLHIGRSGHEGPPLGRAYRRKMHRSPDSARKGSQGIPH